MRAITYDFRGHGASAKVEHGYTLDRFARDAVAVADAAGANRFVVVGYSMSGKFGQYLTLEHPERVGGQVLVSGWPAAEVPFPAEMQRAWVELAGDRDALREFERQFISQPVAPEVVERWLDDAVKVPRVALDETLMMTVRTSFADRVAAIRAPTLVVAGAHDPIASPVFCGRASSPP